MSRIPCFANCVIRWMMIIVMFVRDGVFVGWCLFDVCFMCVCCVVVVLSFVLCVGFVCLIWRCFVLCVCVIIVCFCMFVSVIPV